MTATHTLLLLALTLHISEEQHSFVVRSQDLVTLSCGDVSQTSCSKTIWTHHTPAIQSNDDRVDQTAPTTNCVKDYLKGIVGPNPFTEESQFGKQVLVQSGSVCPGPMYHRLNLTENCELQIRNVDTEDAGIYICNQLNQSQASVSFLSVVTMLNRGVIGHCESFCAVFPYGGPTECGFTVRWRLLDTDKHPTQPNFRTWKCSAKATSPNIDSISKLHCEVTDLNHNRIFVFSNMIKASQWNQTENKEEDLHESIPVLTVLMLVLRSVELLMASVVMVILIRVSFRCSSVTHHQTYKDTRGFQNIRFESTD